MVEIKKNIPIAKFSTFKIGGKARFFCEVKSDQELLEAINAAKGLKISYKLIAGGSNVVFPDKILNCLLIRIKKLSPGGLVKVIGNKVIVDPSMNLMALINKVITKGLGGLETLSGIPGTVGGAIVGNAGAYGHSISEIVEKIEVWNPFFASAFAKASADKKASAGRQGKWWLKNKDCKFGYRHSILKEKPLILLRAVLRFKKINPQELKRISRNIIQTRLKKYKPGLCCPGSFFKNILVNPHTIMSCGLIKDPVFQKNNKTFIKQIVKNKMFRRKRNNSSFGVGVKDVTKKSLLMIPKDKIIEGKIPAGYLLETVGAKGMKVGGIRIADFHGNLFINDGKGKASDVKKLAKILKDRVRKKFGIRLEEEIRYF